MRAIGVAAARPVAKARERIPVWALQLAFLAVHAPFALMIPKRSGLVTMHALAVFALGLIAALLPRGRPFVAYAIAYIAGGEVFWRMKEARVPWEFGKVAIAALCAVALVRTWKPRRPMLTIAYLLLLLPSAFLTLASTPWADARDMLSFNLAGPIALAAAALFFSSLRLSPAQMRWLMIAMLAPIVGIATVAAALLQSYMQSLKVVEFYGASNLAASGAFGPNQVASTLGLGVVAVALYLMLGRTNLFAAGTLIVLLLFLVRQSMVTFSRSGIYMAAGSIVAAAFYLLRERRVRGKVLVGGAVVAVLLALVVIPRLNAMTGGKFGTRFEDTSTTGRDLLVAADLRTWSENPFLGVGVGLGGSARLKFFKVSSAHTEYTRLVAEHGLLGLAALVVLCVVAARNVLERKTWREKAVAAALAAYGFLYMAVDATRLVAPSFAIGLSCVSLAVVRRRVRAVPVPHRPSIAAGERAS